MGPLIDCDVLLYEIGSIGQYIEDDTLHIRSFDFVQTKFDEKVDEICKAVGATQPPILFLTDNSTNFRNDVAVRKGYKANRDNRVRPFHYKNLKMYVEMTYHTVISRGGEADDELAIAQCSALSEGRRDTVICTRDKDLRMVPGFQYGWECGKQPEYYLRFISDDDIGTLDAVFKENKLSKVVGTGLKWFYYQLLRGDDVDNIPGVKGIGPVKAYAALSQCSTEAALFASARSVYETVYGEAWREELYEQAYLVWMVRERDAEGNLVMWRCPDERV